MAYLIFTGEESGHLLLLLLVSTPFEGSQRLELRRQQSGLRCQKYFCEPKPRLGRQIVSQFSACGSTKSWPTNTVSQPRSRRRRDPFGELIDCPKFQTG